MSDYLVEQAAAYRELADTMSGPLDCAALTKLAADCEDQAELVRRHALTLVAMDQVNKGQVYSQEQIENWAKQRKAERRQQKDG